MPWIRRRHVGLFALIGTIAVMHPVSARVQTGWTGSNVQFEIGANYHATTPDFGSSAFIRRYHVPAVRSTVIDQLQGMALAGAGVIKTTLWVVGRGNESWRLSFPLSNQELANIESYARDVAATPRPGGGYLSLGLTLAWLGCAEYTVGSPSGTVGRCRLTWNAFKANAESTIDSVVQRVGGIVRPDGRKVVSKIYLDLEVMVGAKPNQDRFLRDLYPFFLARTAQAGLDGSIYFLVTPSEAQVINDRYEDAEHPVLSGRLSLFWLYRSIHFLRTHGLPVPARVDFSFFPEPRSATYAELVNRVFSDFQAVFPDTRAAVVETFYFGDDRRVELGQAFAASFLARGLPEEVVFWTTPVEGVARAVGPPFDVAAFLLRPPAGPSSVAATPNPCAPRADGVTCETTIHWSTSAASATAALWLDADGDTPSRLACGKDGEAVVSNLDPNRRYRVTLWATPWCDSTSTTQTGIAVAATEVRPVALDQTSDRPQQP
jgi:hypothetical protein